MRHAMILVLALPLAAQENPGETKAADQTFEFEVEQGWSLTFDADDKLGPAVTESELLDGVEEPRISFPEREDPESRARDRRIRDNLESRMPRPATRRRRADPLKLEGSLVLREDGKFVVNFTRIEYFDANRRWWIEYKNRKVVAHNLGGTGRWMGRPDEWMLRLGRLERSCLNLHLLASSPQREAKSGKINAGIPQEEDPARRLFISASTEEQMTALLLARLNGTVLTEKPPEVPKDTYPPRVLRLAGQLMGRILAQCRGTLAPQEAVDGRKRKVQGREWNLRNLAVPFFDWNLSSDEERTRALTEARRRLNDLARKSHEDEEGILQEDWDRAVDAELEKINAPYFLKPGALPSGIYDVKSPRIISVGRATYDYEETLKTKKERLGTSKVVSDGTIKDMVLWFFDSSQNRFRGGKTQVHTWYKGTVTRKD